MKKIINARSTTEIAENDIPNSPVIGFEVGQDCGKGWLQHEKDGSYTALSVSNGVRHRNGWGNKSLRDWFVWGREGVPAYFFLFDNEVELFKWLSK